MQHRKANQQNQHDNAACLIIRAFGIWMKQLLENQSVRSKNKLSLLIPTFCRYGKLARNLIYLSEVAASDLIPSGRCDDIEVIIADGTPADFNDQRGLLKPKFLEVLEVARKSLKVMYIESPESSYFRRFYELVSASSSEIVSLLGDEDLFVFDSLADIFSLFNDRNINTVAGRYIDIHGYQRGRLKYSLHEGWFNEFKIESSSAIERLRAYMSTRGIGISPTSYSVNRREFMIDVSKKMLDNEKCFSYTNAERFLNFYRIASGSMYSISKPLYLRDRTFVGRGHDDPLWSDSSLDSQMEELLSLVIYECCEEFCSPKEVAEFLKSSDGFRVTNQGHLLEMRSLMDAAQPWLSSYLAGMMSSSTVNACERSWQVTINDAYPGTDLSNLGVPPLWKSAAYKIMNVLR